MLITALLQRVITALLQRLISGYYIIIIWKATWSCFFFSDRNPSRGMRSLLKAFKYMLSPCTKTLSMVVEFHSITGIVCAVNSADKLMKEHFFPRDWPTETSMALMNTSTRKQRHDVLFLP